MKSKSLLLAACFSSSLFAQNVGIVGGDDGAGDPLSFLVSLNGELTPVSPLPSQVQILSVASDGCGTFLLCGFDSLLNTPFAAIVSSTGAATILSPLFTNGELNETAINSSGYGIIGGRDSTSNLAFAASVSPSGTLSSYNLLTDAAIQSVAINESGFAIAGGDEILAPFPPYLVLLPSGGMPQSITLTPTWGIIRSVSVNSSGTSLVGGQDNNTGGPYGAIVMQGGSFQDLPAFAVLGNIESVAINDSGLGLIGGRDNSSNNAYAAFVLPGPVLQSVGNVGTGNIESVALNNSGLGLIGGTSAGISYAAQVSPGPVLTPLAVPATVDIDAVAISDSGVGLIGGVDSLTSTPYAALVAPNAMLTPLTFPAGMGNFIAVSIRDACASALTPSSIGPYSSAINGMLAASNALNSHIMIHHKQRWVLEEIQEEISLLADASEELPACAPAYRVCRDPSTLSVYLLPFYDYINQKADGSIPAFTNQIGGTLAAIDYYCANEATLGGGLGYGFNYAHYSNRLGHAKINEEMAFVFASIPIKRLFINATFWGGLYQLDNKRHSPPLPITSKLHTHGWFFSPHLELSLWPESYSWFFWEPFAMFDWVNQWQSKATEKGSSGFNLALDSQYASLLRSEAGFRFYETVRCSWGRVLFEQKASYINRCPFDFNDISTFFVGGSASSFFIATGSESVENLAGVQFNCSFIPSDIRFPYGSINAQGEFGESFQSYFAGVEIGKRF